MVPVTFDGSDHGFLALTGAFDVMEDAVFERFNHWAVLLAVALDQDRAVERLRVSEERYALAAEAANDGMWDWDLATGAVYYSRPLEGAARVTPTTSSTPPPRSG